MLRRAAALGALLIALSGAASPPGPGFGPLEAQLAQHCRVAAAGGWPAVPDGPTIHPGASDPRIAALAARLAASGDLDVGIARDADATYDEALQAAVRRFQDRHGLAVDGLVGPATLRALNVPVERRIDQIRVNLERAERRRDGGFDATIVVNVASYQLHVVRDGETVKTMKVVVGETKDPTPLFRTKMTHIVFNPNWTVPYSIASREILPAIKADPAYLANGVYRLFDREGNAVDASTVDWSAIHSRNFPFTVVQQPGPANQLGRVKFMIPNPHSVCLHDTPARALFSRASRALSHGCIRVSRPLDLAEILLGEEGWTRARIEAQVASGKTRTVILETPVPVAVLYWTAEVGDHGEMRFYDDVYGRDAALLNSLDGPVTSCFR